jgi:tetratricopeptide (TPR) repeat protein
MRKILAEILIIITIFVVLDCWMSLTEEYKAFLKTYPAARTVKIIKPKELATQVSINTGLLLLKSRKDNQAMEVFENILSNQPNNYDALWAKAEILRRKNNFAEAESILNDILKQTKWAHLASLNTLAYIKYYNKDFSGAVFLISKVLNSQPLDNQNKALAFMLLGAINSKRAAIGGLMSKVINAGKIKPLFLKARELAPDLPEVRLSMGTFYLLAPAIIGGNLDKAIKELETTVGMAPEFVTACVRLAQAYKKKGMLDKYNYYISKARELEPENEALIEMLKEK